MSRQKLLEAAARVFAEAGFRGATTRRIAEEAGVNEVTLFRLFGSKAQLLSEAIACVNTHCTVQLPDQPDDVEAELTRYCQANLEFMRQIRFMIRKTMAELDERPEMGAFVAEQKTHHFQHLVNYVTKVRKPRTAAEADDLRTACTMLMTSLFSDAVGREVVPAMYPTPMRDAARKYVRVFLKLLDVNDDEAKHQRADSARHFTRSTPTGEGAASS
jgi:AcrR family transcriptional regulator